MRYMHLRFWLGLCFLFVSTQTIAALVPDRSGVERKLHENRYFLEFIDRGVSNFEDEKSKEMFRKAAQDHFRAYQFYLQGRYDESHEAIRESQLTLRDLYVYMYDSLYRVSALYLLKSNSVVVVSSRDQRAIRLLSLGYRDVKLADIYRHKGYNYPEQLYSVKIYFYIDAIKYLRQSKRYAFLALIETHIPLADKDDLKVQTVDEYFNPETKEYQEDYTRVKNRLTNMINRKLFTDNYDYFTHHDDNYGYISKGRKNLLEKYLLDTPLKKSTPAP